MSGFKQAPSILTMARVRFWDLAPHRTAALIPHGVSPHCATPSVNVLFSPSTAMKTATRKTSTKTCRTGNVLLRWSAPKFPETKSQTAWLNSQLVIHRDRIARRVARWLEPSQPPVNMVVRKETDSIVRETALWSACALHNHFKRESRSAGPSCKTLFVAGHQWFRN